MTSHLPPSLSLWSLDSKAIVDGNLKLILGLVWTLILHYSISMPIWEGEDEKVTVQASFTSPPPSNRETSW